MIRPDHQHLSSFADVEYRRSVSSQVTDESSCCSALTSPNEYWKDCEQAQTRIAGKAGLYERDCNCFQYSFGDHKGLPSSDSGFEWKQGLDTDPEAYERDSWFSFSPAHEIECSGRKRT